MRKFCVLLCCLGFLPNFVAAQQTTGTDALNSAEAIFQDGKSATLGSEGIERRVYLSFEQLEVNDWEVTDSFGASRAGSGEEGQRISIGYRNLGLNTGGLLLNYFGGVGFETVGDSASDFEGSKTEFFAGTGLGFVTEFGLDLSANVVGGLGLQTVEVEGVEFTGSPLSIGFGAGVGYSLANFRVEVGYQRRLSNTGALDRITGTPVEEEVSTDTTGYPMLSDRYKQISSLSWMVVTAVMLTVLSSCINSVENRIAKNPQTASDRVASAAAASAARQLREQSTDGGAFQGDPGRFGCQARDYSSFRVQQVVRSQLVQLQRESFASGVETCGSAIIDNQCNIGVTRTVRGTSHSCTISLPANTIELAIYHTHGISDGTNAGEIPSDTDFRNAISSKIDSFVATPSGRLWRIDSFSQVAELVCRRCMPVDPRSRDNKSLFTVGTSYSYVQLVAAMRGAGIVSGGSANR